MTTPPADLESHTDEQLFSVFQESKSPDAFRVIVQRHHADLTTYIAKKLGGDRHTAADIFQDTCLQLHNSAHTYDASRPFRPWLFRIALNKVRDHQRKTSRRRTAELSAPVDASGDGGTTFVDLLKARCPSPDDGMDRKELVDVVQRALDTLTPKLKEVLILQAFQRLSYAQIAEDLEIPIGTVKSRINAAIASFAKALDALSPEHSPVRVHTTDRTDVSEGHNQ